MIAGASASAHSPGDSLAKVGAFPYLLCLPLRLPRTSRQSTHLFSDKHFFPMWMNCMSVIGLLVAVSCVHFKRTSGSYVDMLFLGI